MCGILAILGLKDAKNFREIAVKLSKMISHRGPDWAGIWINDSNILAHERLAIIDVFTGSQPIRYKNLLLTINAEIYNYKELKEQFDENEVWNTDSDCEVLLHLYDKYGIDFLDKCSINGMFAFVIYDQEHDIYVAARDIVGIEPLYFGFDENGATWFGSELKVLQEHCKVFQTFPPGHYYTSENKFKRYYNAPWYINTSYIPTQHLSYEDIRNALTKSVISHLMSDVPYGILLSGGLDSSLISSIAVREFSRNQRTKRLQSFCIGLKGSPDLIAAQEVADFIGTEHYSFEFTIDEGLDALHDVIYHLESFDIASIRSSIPMYLVSRKIKACGIKMVLSGEGSDEMFGGYLYFHKAPNKEEFYKETVRKIKDLNKLDCLRANKSMLAWGVETRVPFLDTEFLEIVMNIAPEDKMCKNGIEKYLLRKAFDTPDDPYLSDKFLWRQKEQFSDGVGSLWINALKEYADSKVTDKQMKNIDLKFPIGSPKTKEGYMYREIFSKFFPSDSAATTVHVGDTIACSTAIAVEWDESFKTLDPSGRAIKIHQDYQDMR